MMNYETIVRNGIHHADQIKHFQCVASDCSIWFYLGEPLINYEAMQRSDVKLMLGFYSFFWQKSSESKSTVNLIEWFAYCYMRYCQQIRK